MTQIGTAEACALLHISKATLLRRMKKGVYQFTRTGEGQFAELQFTYEGLGLVEPQPEPQPAPVVKAAPEPIQPESEPEQPEPEPSVIWVEAPDGKDVGFSGDVDGVSASERARAYRQLLAAARRRF